MDVGRRKNESWWKVRGGVQIYKIRGSLDVCHVAQIWLSTWQQGSGCQWWDSCGRGDHALPAYKAWACSAWTTRPQALAHLSLCTVLVCRLYQARLHAQCRTSTCMHSSVHNAMLASGQAHWLTVVGVFLRIRGFFFSIK